MTSRKPGMNIQWPETDQTFVVSPAEPDPYCRTHRDTFVEAFKNGEHVIEMFIGSAQECEEPLPAAKVNHPTIAG